MTPVAAPAPAAAPAPSPAAATAATPAPQASGTVAAADAKPYRPPSGYRAKKLGANTVYCKKDTTLGTRFPTEFCFTEDELKEMERRGDDMRQNKLKNQGLCGGASTACGNGSG
ncbi:MAG TPA: hypothetical protein VE046_12820 [Steroidobacteraceae bacterium]|nr:hypothetical protein [Steroidobacteraceae bacterium]